MDAQVEQANKYVEQYQEAQSNLIKYQAQSYGGNAVSTFGYDISKFAKFTENGKSEIELKAGESKEIKYYGETALSSGKDISFENSAEVVDVQKTVNSGRSINLQHSNFYDRAEWVTITPPTGEDRNYTPIIITSIVMLAILGTGVVIIIKSVLK